MQRAARSGCVSAGGVLLHHHRVSASACSGREGHKGSGMAVAAGQQSLEAPVTSPCVPTPSRPTYGAPPAPLACRAAPPPRHRPHHLLQRHRRQQQQAWRHQLQRAAAPRPAPAVQLPRRQRRGRRQHRALPLLRPRRRWVSASGSWCLCRLCLCSLCLCFFSCTGRRRGEAAWVQWRRRRWRPTCLARRRLHSRAAHLLVLLFAVLVLPIRASAPPSSAGEGATPSSTARSLSVEPISHVWSAGQSDASVGGPHGGLERPLPLGTTLTGGCRAVSKAGQVDR